MKTLRFAIISALLIACSSFFPNSHFKRSTRRGVFDWSSIESLNEEKMSKSFDVYQQNINALRAGKVSPQMLDNVHVKVEGSPVLLSKISRISPRGPETLVIESSVKNICQQIEKAIVDSRLGGVPAQIGDDLIQVTFPPMSEERRAVLVKQAKATNEQGKIAIRNIRRDIIDKVKQAEKSKEIVKDQSMGYQEMIQKVTDKFIKKMDDALVQKEKQLAKLS